LRTIIVGIVASEKATVNFKHCLFDSLICDYSIFYE
jgi:hypothetical protein